MDLPDDVLPLPKDEKEKILQDGYIKPSTIKFGFIGVDHRVLEFASILKSTFPFHTDVMGVSSVTPKALQILKERYGESFEESSITQLLSKNIDWIFIDSEYSTVAENIVCSLQSGKHVFCEKPVCKSIEDCIRIKEAHKQSGKQFLGAFVWRLVPFYKEIFDVLRYGVLGIYLH